MAPLWLSRRRPESLDRWRGLRAVLLSLRHVVVAEDDAALRRAVADRARAVGRRRLLRGGHVVEPDAAHPRGRTRARRDVLSLLLGTGTTLGVRAGRSERDECDGEQNGQLHDATDKAGSVPPVSIDVSRCRTVTWNTDDAARPRQTVQVVGIRVSYTGRALLFCGSRLSALGPKAQSPKPKAQSPKLIPDSRAVRTT